MGIDIQDSQLEMGRQEARNRGIDNVRFEHASVYKLPFEEATFDAVLAHAMVYHLGEPMKALHEIRRVLKPSGVCRIIVPEVAAIVGWYLAHRAEPAGWSVNPAVTC